MLLKWPEARGFSESVFYSNPLDWHPRIVLPTLAGTIADSITDTLSAIAVVSSFPDWLRICLCELIL